MRKVHWLFAVTATVAGVAQAAPLLAQADDETEFFCIAPTNFDPTARGFRDLPGLSVTLRTRGRPVLILVSATLISGSGVNQLRPAIDGQPLDAFISHVSGTGGTVTAQFSRAYSIDSGLHTFTAQVDCPEALASWGQRWITVIEIN